MLIEARSEMNSRRKSSVVKKTHIKSLRYSVEYDAFFSNAADEKGQLFCAVLLVDGKQIASYQRSVNIEDEVRLSPKLAESRLQGELRIATKYLFKMLMNYFLDEVEQHAPPAKLYAQHVKPGRPSIWNKKNLAEDIRAVLNTIPRKKDQTLARVAKELKVMNPKHAPESGESLRKLIDRLGLDWKALKAEY